MSRRANKRNGIGRRAELRSRARLFAPRYHRLTIYGFGQWRHKVVDKNGELNRP